MEQIGVLNRVSTVDALIQAFSNEIINGAWEPGVYCKDTDMAEKYGVSRNSVREAFSVLVEKGLLKRRNNKGFFVPVLGEEDVRELYEARLKGTNRAERPDRHRLRAALPGGRVRYIRGRAARGSCIIL